MRREIATVSMETPSIAPISRNPCDRQSLGPARLDFLPFLG